MRRAHGMLHAIRSRAGQMVGSDVEVLKSTIVGETERGEVGKGLLVPAKYIQLKCKRARAGPEQYDYHANALWGGINSDCMRSRQKLENRYRQSS